MERKVLQNETSIGEIVKYSLVYFVLSFIAFPHPLFIILNSFFVLHVIYLCFRVFQFIESFYKTVISDKQITDKYIKKDIKDNISKYYEISTENNKLNDDIENLGNVSRFLSEDHHEEYTLVRSEKAGYVQKIDLDLFKNIGSKKSELEGAQTLPQDPVQEKDLIYIPFSISKGVEISVGDILYGVKKGTDIPKNAVRLTNENFFPVQDYLNVVLTEKFNEIFNYIRDENYKSVEEKLNESATYINFVFDEEKFNTNIIEKISAEFIYPLQEEAFKRGDFRVIRQVSSFSLKYLYKSIDQKSKDKFEIFIRNLTTAFFYSLSLKDLGVKKMYQQGLNHWLYELLEFSFKSRLLRNKDDEFYSEAIEKTFVAINNMLKYAYDKKDVDSLDSVVYLASSVFVDKPYERADSKTTKALKERKESVIFGFTSCVYRDMKRKGAFDSDILEKLYTLIPKDLEGLLRSASGALSRSDNSKFNWDNLSWSNEEGYLGVRSGTITTDHDVILLLIDRLFYGLKNNQITNLAFSSEIENELLAIYSQAKDLNQTDIQSATGMSETQFAESKTKIVGIFEQIKSNYEERTANELVEQKINEDKVKDYANKNFIGYSKNALLRSFSSIKIIASGSARGYNQLFYKERFVDKTNLHITDDETFGESLARSEDNYLLHKIIESKPKLEEINIGDLGKLLKEKSSSFKYAVIWAKNHIFLEDVLQGSKFVPRWQVADNDSKQRGFQGTVDSLEIYNVYPFKEDNAQIDTILFVNKDDIELDEFQPKKDTSAGTYSVSSDENHLEFSIRNLSELDDTELGKIKINPEPPKDLKSKVTLQLYKGSELGGATKIDSIEIYKITQ
jgi:hypothetical protein